MPNEAVRTAAEPLPGNALPPSRRRFYLAGIYGLWGAIGVALSVPAFIYLFFPPKAKRETEWVDAAALSQLPANTPEEVVFRRNRVDGWKITSEKATAWVVKSSSGEVVAFAPQCTHLGCAYHWDERNHNFLCPCHTSTFSLDGQVLSGPAPRPLDRYRVQVNGDRIQIGPVDRRA
jgi:menaquinol-cytochrome c reductase iron-sulfur subunit